MNDDNDRRGRGGYRDRGRGGHGGHGGGGRYDDRSGGGFDDRGPKRRGTPLSELDPKLTETSRQVIGCAIEVHKELGPGYPREVYLNALMLEMGDEEIAHEKNVGFKIFYGDDEVGEVQCDLFIAERFLLRVVAESREIGGQDRSELRAQLRAADLELGLIINFGERRLKDGLVRVLNPDKLNAMQEGADTGGEAHDDEGDDDGDDD